MAPQPPDRPFDPFVPSDDEPWDRPRIHHLLRRAAIGPTPEQFAALSNLSPGQAVDSLLDYDVAQDPFNDLLTRMEGFFNFNRIEDVQGWFFFSMLGSPRRAQERMALFWHNHFATSASKVDRPKLMHNQIELFRQKGSGSFRDLLLAVARDPAMLVWLDGQASKKGHANENFSRESMELFTLGIGNYTEQDVQELARAFTGWQLQGDQAVFNPKLWDDGEKTIFNTPGKYDSQSAVDLMLAQPAAPKHLAEKLLKEFVHPEPTQDHIDYVAGQLLANNWQIKPVMKQIFTSRLFYSEWAYRSRIKSPVELVAGAIIGLGGKANTDFITQTTARMGQKILFPPNVKGWDGGEAWINANTVLVRFNFGLVLATQQQNIYAERPDVEAMLHGQGATTAPQVVDFFDAMLLDGRLPDDENAKFVQFLENSTTTSAQTRPAFVLNHGTYYKSVRDVMQLMMATPEYQLA
jgi:uncharacterized protein (DUF1800 family)